MTIDFTCQKCETSFEVDAQELIDGSEKLICPNCKAKAAVAQVDDFVAALTEMRSQVATLAKKFSVNMAIETEDLEDELASKEDEDDDEELDLEDDEVEGDDEDEAR